MSEFLTLSEEKLFELVKAGNQAAYSELYERFKKPLLVYAVNKVPPIEAEDIVHDLFIKLWDNRKDIQITGNFSHYIFRSLRNRIIDFFCIINMCRNILILLESFPFTNFLIYLIIGLERNCFMLRLTIC